MKFFSILFLIFFMGYVSVSQTETLNTAKNLIYKNPTAAIDLVANYLHQDNYLGAKAYSITGKAYEVQGLYTTAYGAYAKGINTLYGADTLDYYLEYAIFNNMAMIAFESNQYNMSSNLYGKAAEAAERYVKHDAGVAAYYNEQYLPNKMKFYQANAMYDAGDLDGALDIYLELDKQFKTEVKDVNTYALLRNEYGLNAKAVKKLNDAEYYFNSIINMDKVSGYYKQSAMHNLALVKMEMGDTLQALRCFNEAINLPGQGIVDKQRFISMMDKGELLLDMNKNKEAVHALHEALALGVDIKHDLRLINIYYLLERASKKLNLDKSDGYGDIYQGMIASHIKRQGEIISQEKARVFHMALNEAKYNEKIEALKRSYSYRLFFNIVLFVAIAIVITYLGVWCNIKLKIRRTITR